MIIKATPEDVRWPYYIKEEDIKIKGGYVGNTDIEYNFGDEVRETKVRKIEYPISTTTNIDAVTVNQSTDISGLTSALDKMNETLEKVLDKLS